MKSLHFILAVAALAGLSAGCSSTDYGSGSPYQPGPVAGKTTGNAVGVVAGNVAGFGKGIVQGTEHGISATQDRSYHMVRYWRDETTADGRTIHVPYDILVDQYGRPAKMPAPTGNPAPPPGTTVAPMSETNGAAR